MTELGKVYTKIERCDAKVLKGLSKIPTTIASDVMGRAQMMHSSIKPMTHPVHIAGSAVTVKCTPGNNLLVHQALYAAQPGDILVIDGKGFTERSIWGGVQTFVAKQRKFAAVIVDGTVRDSAEIRKSGIPVFCKGATPAGPLKETSGNVNGPIMCGGLKVSPGDIIIADEDGVVVVPLKKAAEVLKKARERLTVEKKWMSGLKKGKTTLDVIGLQAQLDKLNVKILNTTFKKGS